MTITSASPTRIAIAGAGLIGQTHIAAMARRPELRLSAPVDPSPAAAAVAERAPVPLAGRVARPRPARRPGASHPNALHVPQALQCMAEGLPTLLEKPIATTVAEGRTLVDVVKRTGARGSLSVPTMRLKTYPSAADSSWWKPFDCSVVPMTRQDPLLPQMAHFGAVVRGEVAPLVSARDGLQNLQVTESIVEAARSERLVELG